ncbi:MAG: putative toxin-antitoxin system toxin component, PIN family [Micropepsaceae bacterium]
MRIVLDTNVIIAAMRSPRGASAELLQFALQKRVTLVGGLTLALEYLDVCARAESREGTDITEADAVRFANQVIVQLTATEIRFRWRPTTPDPGDEHVVETALNGGAAAIVTFNKRDLANAAAQFGLQVLTPADTLRKLES